MVEAVAKSADTSKSNVWTYILELAPEQMVELGRVLPQPGEEPQWIAALPDAERERMQAIGRSGLPG
jgi:hypothetical protein